MESLGGGATVQVADLRTLIVGGIKKRETLHQIASDQSIALDDRRAKTVARDAILASPLSADAILNYLDPAELRGVLRSLGLDTKGAEEVLRVRILTSRPTVPASAASTTPLSIVDAQAAESAVGYLYQCRYALLLAIERGAEDRWGDISIEDLDDIKFAKDGAPLDLIQTKHHSVPGNLTDASSDLWRTLRIWCDAASQQLIEVPGTVLTLVTTSAASTPSAAANLRPGPERDVASAMTRLQDTATTSKSESNSAAYESFLRLPDEKRRALVGSIYVLDRSPNVLDVQQRILTNLYYVTRPEHHEAFVERLEGWWFARVIGCLSSESRPVAIGVGEVHEQITYLQECFQSDNLPIDFLDAEPPEGSSLDDMAFVHQLKLVAVSEPRIRAAIRDYYCAFVQRSKWVREDLLVSDGEIQRYERRLLDEWSRRFNLMKEDLPSDSDEDAQIRAGRALFNWVDMQAQIHIRPKCTQPYVMRGFYHDLADGLRIGWHPDFVDRLKHLLDREAS